MTAYDREDDEGIDKTKRNEVNIFSSFTIYILKQILFYRLQLLQNSLYHHMAIGKILYQEMQM